MINSLTFLYAFVFYWYLAHCQSVTELAMLPPSAEQSTQ